MAREAEIYYSEDSVANILLEAGKQADTRDARGIRHLLGNMLICLLCAFLTRHNTLRGTAKWIKTDKIKTRLESYLTFEHGMPCASTFSRTLRAADNVIIMTHLADFFYLLTDHKPEDPEHLCLDGKILRAAQSKVATGYSLDIENMFNASYNLFLFQMRVGAKKQEGKEIENEIFNLLMGYDSCVITGDAMITRKEIMNLICQSNCEAVLPVKNNNKNLKNLLLEIIEEEIMTNPDNVASFVDIGPFSSDDVASAFHENTKVKIFEEDNRNVTPEDTYENNETKLPESEETSPSVDESLENIGLSDKESTSKTSTPSLLESSENNLNSGENSSSAESNDCKNNPTESSSSTAEASERNCKTDDSSSENKTTEPKTVEDFKFYDTIYKYTKAEFSNNRVLPPKLDPSNKRLEYFLIDGRWVPFFKTHGRFERREYDLLINQETLAQKMLNPVFLGWDEVAQVGIVTRYRAELRYDSETKARCYHISITRTPYILTKEHTVQEFAEFVKSHWSIETFHGIIDNLFKEDKSTIRSGSSPENCSLIRNMAFDLLTVLNQMQNNDKDYSVKGYSELADELDNDPSTLFKLIFSRIRSPFK